MAFVTPVVEHWLEREIAQWVHHEGSIRRPIAPWANALTTELHLAPLHTTNVLHYTYVELWNINIVYVTLYTDVAVHSIDVEVHLGITITNDSEGEIFERTL